MIPPACPQVSNHNDLDPPRLHPEIDFRWIGPGEAPPAADLIVLPGSSPGLGILDCVTTLKSETQLHNVSGQPALPGQPAMTGYEIHLGVRCGDGLAQPAVHLADGRSEGIISDDDQVFATHCHGNFGHPEALTTLLAWAGLKAAERINFAACREAALDRLADSGDAALDREKLRPLLPGI